MRLLGFQIANGYSSEARVFASLLGARPKQEAPDDILVVHHEWPGDRNSAAAFRKDAAVDLETRDLGWRPVYPKRPFLDRVRARLDFELAKPGLRRIARDFHPNIVLSAQQQWDCAAASSVATYLGVPGVIHLHYNVGPWLGRGTLHRLRTCAHTVTVSDFIRRQVLAFGVPPERVTTIHNSMRATDPPRGCLHGRDALLRDEFGIPSTAPLITFVSRVDPGKGHRETIEAFTGLTGTASDAYLLIVGDGAIRSELEAMAQKTARASRIIFTGRRQDVAGLLAASDIFVHPSYSDPFPLAVLEASAAGLPVVAFADGGIPEMVEQGETGILVDTGDTTALRGALASLLANPERAREMGAAGRARIQTTFTPEQASARFFDLLHRVAAGEPSAQYAESGGSISRGREL